MQWSRVGQPELNGADLWALSYIESTPWERCQALGALKKWLLVVSIFLNIQIGEGYEDENCLLSAMGLWHGVAVLSNFGEVVALSQPSATNMCFLFVEFMHIRTLTVTLKKVHISKYILKEMNIFW